MLASVVAVVDIGSNSVKVLVAKMQHGAMEELHMDAETTSLARQLPQTGQLSNEAILSTLAALERFKLKINELGVKEVKIVGTAAMREASNSQVLVDQIKEIFSSPTEIISGIREAELALRGAMTARPDNTDEAECLFADLGGASTEVGFSKPQTTPYFHNSRGTQNTCGPSSWWRATERHHVEKRARPCVVCFRKRNHF
jgi:exopolyphosphatase/guanosine-5'-triphosphate,3'-diphosphate pyrophosphatase